MSCHVLEFVRGDLSVSGIRSLFINIFTLFVTKLQKKSRKQPNVSVIFLKLIYFRSGNLILSQTLSSLVYLLDYSKNGRAHKSKCHLTQGFL